MPTNCTPKACLLAIALLSLLSTRAQFHFGIKAGVSVSNISERTTLTNKTDYHSRVMGIGGFFAHINLGQKLLLRPESVLTGKGAKTKYTYYYTYNTTTTQYERTVRVTFSYVDIPINLLYAIPFGQKNPLGQKKLLAGGGPVISFLLNKHANYGMGTNDLGANLLLLYEWPIGFSIGVNYMQGIKDITYNYNSNTTKNHYTGFTIGYWF